MFGKKKRDAIKVGEAEGDKFLMAQQRKRMGLDPEPGDENATIDNAFDNIFARFKDKD